jgi:hypothetical protein
VQACASYRRAVHQILLGNEINEGKMGWGREGKDATCVGCLLSLVRKRKGKRPLGRSRRRWKNCIKIKLAEMRCKSMDWTKLAQDKDRRRAIVNTAIKLWDR